MHSNIRPPVTIPDSLHPPAFGQCATSAEVVSDPLGFILFEHQQQETVCSQLETLVNDLTKPHVPESATAIIAYLTEDFPAYVMVEEYVLFPLLQSRCRKDSIGTILSKLHHERDQDWKLVDKVIEDLTAISAEVPLGVPSDFIISALQLVERWRRHLSWEERTVLPLAREWLSNTDLIDLGHAMVACRPSNV